MVNFTSGRSDRFGFKPSTLENNNTNPNKNNQNKQPKRPTQTASSSSNTAGIDDNGDDEDLISMETTEAMANFTSGRDRDISFSPATFSSNGSQQVVTHVEAGCDGCRQCPLIGVRYKCLYCPNFDLCSTCLESLEAFQPTNSTNSMFGSRKKPIHDPNHRFVRMASAIPVSKLPTYLQNREDMVHRGIACNTCDKREIVGYRYFCPQCGVSLCEACELIGKQTLCFLIIIIIPYVHFG